MARATIPPIRRQGYNQGVPLSMSMPNRAVNFETNGSRSLVQQVPVTGEECQGLRMLNFGSRLSLARHEAGMTTEAVAAIMKMTRQQISNWEAGRYRPQLRPEKIEKFHALADSLGVRFEWLMDGEEPMRKGGESAPRSKPITLSPALKAGETLQTGNGHTPSVSEEELRILERSARALLDQIESLRNRLRGL